MFLNIYCFFSHHFKNPEYTIINRVTNTLTTADGSAIIGSPWKKVNAAMAEKALLLVVIIKVLLMILLRRALYILKCLLVSSEYLFTYWLGFALQIMMILLKEKNF